MAREKIVRKIYKIIFSLLVVGVSYTYVMPNTGIFAYSMQLYQKKKFLLPFLWKSQSLLIYTNILEIVAPMTDDVNWTYAGRSEDVLKIGLLNIIYLNNYWIWTYFSTVAFVAAWFSVDSIALMMISLYLVLQEWCSLVQSQFSCIYL